jgi:hypothetical protein
MRWFVAMALSLLTMQAAGGGSTGTIAGTALDTTGGALPGTTITLRAGSIERTAVTDPKGAFSITGLPPGRYTAIARLAGFEGASHLDVEVTSGQTATLKFVLRVGCLGHVDYIDNGLPWVISQSDVIAHIRIPSLEIPVACPATSSANHCACALHQATVVRVLRGDIGESRGLRLIQEGAGARGQEQPYAPGDEFIAFLKLDPNAAAFTRVIGPHYMFRVRDGSVDLEGRHSAWSQNRDDCRGIREGAARAAVMKPMPDLKLRPTRF